MRYECVPARELDGSTLSAWQDLLGILSQFNSPFLSPWFTRTVAEVRDDVFVTLIEDGQKLVGFFPHQRRGKRALPVAGILNDCHAAVVHPGADWSPKEMLRASDVNLWDFSHLLGAQSEFRPFAKTIVDAPIIRLSNGFDAYLRERKDAGSKQIDQIRRKRRKLVRECGGEANVRFEPLSRDTAAMRQMIDWKIAQCERTGTPVFFREPWAVELIERLLRLETKGCKGALSVLRVGDDPAAVHFGIRSKSTWHWWFPTYSESWSSYSPGKILLLDLCEYVADPNRSQTRIDLGAGDDAYKASFENGHYTVMTGHLSLGSPYAAVRSAKNGIFDWARKAPLLSPVRKAKRLMTGR
ncbi:MAG: GNAT family N-acetyltransferase [Paracoccaceae bacterium]|nr:GNAT family N-acetyltransferase [Paracoccaceae bacterium]